VRLLPAQIESRLRALRARLPEHRRLKRVVIPVVSRPDLDGPLRLDEMLVMDIGGACPASGCDGDSSVHADDSIFGKPLPLAPEQLAAWRSDDETKRFPQTPEEVAIWRSAEALIGNWPQTDPVRRRRLTTKRTKEG
jgi:hypothetical protein